MRFVKLTLLLLLFSLRANAQFQVVLIDSFSSTGSFDYSRFLSECSLVINPDNPAEIVTAGIPGVIYYSTDTGATWNYTHLNFTNPIIIGDPLMIMDDSGNYYVFILNFTDCYMYKSSDGGQTWSNNILIPTANANCDKEIACFDNTGGAYHGNMYLTYMEMIPNGWNNVIAFAKSTDRGQTWTSGNYISDTSVYLNRLGSYPVLGPNGEIYVVWTSDNYLMFNKSLDGGQTWLNSEQKIDSIYSSNIYLPFDNCDSPFVIPEFVCDRSGGPYTGNLYMTSMDLRSQALGMDVLFYKSTDGGTNWSSVRIDPADMTYSNQFGHALTVDQTTGYIYITYMDKSAYQYLSDSMDYKIAWSTDGGQTFQYAKVMQSPIVGYNVAGHYTSISATHNIIRPVWSIRTDVSGGHNLAYTALIDYASLQAVGMNDPVQESMASVYPNPVNVSSIVNYWTKQSSECIFRLYDYSGKLVCSESKGNQAAGWHAEPIGQIMNQREPGIYLLEIETGYSTIVLKLVVASRR